MIRYVGISPGEQVRRDLWSVVLGARFALSDWISPNPAGAEWAPRIAEWSKAVAAGKTLIAATVSPAALQGSHIRYPYDARAVVDVTVLGGEAGDSVSSVVARMDGLTTGVAVVAVHRILNSDPIARGALLQEYSEQARKGGIGDTIDKVTAVLLILAIAAAIAAGVYAFRTFRK